MRNIVKRDVDKKNMKLKRCDHTTAGAQTALW